MRRRRLPPAKPAKPALANFSVSLPADLLRRLDAVVARKFSSRSRETRDALIEHLKREEASPWRPGETGI